MFSRSKKTGKLRLEQRKQLWKNFEDKVTLNHLDTDEKEIRLAIRTLTKVTNTFNESIPIFLEIKACVENINKMSDDTESLVRKASELYELVWKEMKGSEDFYIIYMIQAFRAFAMMLEGDSDEENIEDSGSVPDDEDLEIEELDISYCACVLWIYQDPAAPAKARKRKEQEFWEWYIREAAMIQGITLREERDDGETVDVAYIRLESIGDLVRGISYEMEYLDRCEKKDDAKEIRIYVYNLKDGTRCPTCGRFSNHISTSFSGIMKFGKIKGWQLIFEIKENICICDNPDCPENEFMPTEEVDYKEKMANYKYIKSIPGNEEKLCKLLGISTVAHKKKDK